jgi:2-nitrobenzoate nitroreductase
MANITLSDISVRERYWLITGSVGPRPIALVTSLSADGLCNAAPFSAFNYLCEDPPLLALGVDTYGDESHRPGERKDTLKNIQRSGEFVVNMVDEDIVHRAVACATDHPATTSEIDAAGFGLAPSTTVSVPRIIESPIAWECRLFDTLSFGERTVVLGEIVAMYFRDDLFDADKVRVHVDRFKPVGRLGGPNYCTTGDRFKVPVAPFGGLGVPRV